MITDLSFPLHGKNLDTWLVAYKQDHKTLLQNDREFARYLEEEYIPLAGGWQY